MARKRQEWCAVLDRRQYYGEQKVWRLDGHLTWTFFQSVLDQLYSLKAVSPTGEQGAKPSSELEVADEIRPEEGGAFFDDVARKLHGKNSWREIREADNRSCVRSNFFLGLPISGLLDRHASADDTATPMLQSRSCKMLLVDAGVDDSQQTATRQRKRRALT